MFISGLNQIQSTNFTAQKKCDKNISDNGGKSKKLLLGSLIALSTFAPVELSSKESYKENCIEQVQSKPSDDEIRVEFKDDNGILEPTDFSYSSEDTKKKAQQYLDGLKFYMGKPCTQAVSDMASNLADVFNRSNSYVYDFNTDELVKEAKSSIAYDKSGRVLSTTLTYSTGDKEVVTYKYFPGGSIDRAVYSGDKVIEYRKDGTRFSVESTDPFRPKKIIRYNKKGAPVYKSVNGKNYSVEVTYDDNGEVIKHFSKNSQSGFQKIYNNGELMLTTLYDGKGRVKNYTDNYFEKQGEDIVVSGYLSQRVIHSGQTYNVLYKQAPLDAKIDKPIRQGTTGTCYAAGIVNSLVRISAGIKLLDEVLPNDFDTDKCVVDFKGLNKRYSIPADVVSHHMSRLGRKDADYAGMIMAYEKFRESDELYSKKNIYPEWFLKEYKGEDDRRVDSGTPKEFFYALSGQVMEESGDKITDSDIIKARKCLASGRGIVNAGTIQVENKNDEIPQADREFGVVPKHNVSVIGINDKNVIIYDSVTEKETAYPISKFKKYFGKLYWAEVMDNFAIR